MSLERKTWFGLDLQQRVTSQLAKHPGLIADMIGQQFIVKLEWLNKGAWCTNGERELDAWTVGTRGMVSALKFSTSHGWEVSALHGSVQRDRSPGLSTGGSQR